MRTQTARMSDAFSRALGRSSSISELHSSTMHIVTVAAAVAAQQQYNPPTDPWGGGDPYAGDIEYSNDISNREWEQLSSAYTTVSRLS